MLVPEQKLIAEILDYTPLNDVDGIEPADTSCCFHSIEERDGWPHILWRKDWYPVPTMEAIEEWVFDSICETPDETTVEPDHPQSWLSLLGLI